METMSGAPDTMGKVPLQRGQTTMSPTRATNFPWMSKVKSALITVPPWLVRSPSTTNGKVAMPSLSALSIAGKSSRL